MSSRSSRHPQPCPDDSAQEATRNKPRLTIRTFIHTFDPCATRTIQKKRAANLRKRGYDFRDAPQVIEADGTVTFEDRRFDYDEQRFITLGMLRGDVVVIATAETDEEIRVISTRRAGPNEEEIYCGNI